MRLEWLLDPAVLYAMQAVSLSMCLLLFVSLKRDLWRSEKRWKAKLDALEVRLTEKAQAPGAEASRASSPLAAPAPPRSELNQSRRGQALEMFRQGAAPNEVAAALTLPLNEAELLLKVNQIELAGPAGS